MERLLYWLLGKQGNGRHSIKPSRFQMRYMFYDWLVIGNAYCVYLMFPFELWTHVKLCFHCSVGPVFPIVSLKIPQGCKGESFVVFSLPWRIYISSIDEVAKNFFPPLPHGWCRKRLFPTFASGDTGFEIVSFPLALAFHWDGMNLLKQRDRKQS